MENDTVTAYFTDGTVESGSFLVGAHGVQSSVRKQYMPEFNAIDTDMRVIFRKTPMTNECVAKLPGSYHRGMSLVSNPDDEARMSLMFEYMHFPHAGDIAQFQLPSPYFYWVFVIHRTMITCNDDKIWNFIPAKRLSAQFNLRRCGIRICEPSSK
jgi:2-polyprenyl-6-methoxyphenol hydroxylase-like FAD-dependent oxidoreductase